MKKNLCNNNKKKQGRKKRKRTNHVGVDLQAVRLPVAQLKGKVFFLPVSLTCGNLSGAKSAVI